MEIMKTRIAKIRVILGLLYFSSIAGFHIETIAQEEVFPGADKNTPSLAQYFTWINSTVGGPTEELTLINMDFFQWMHDEYGMQLDIYAFDADVIDYRGPGSGSMKSERFKRNFPNSFDVVNEKAKSLGMRLGIHLTPDGFGDTPSEEKERIDMLVSLCRDYNFRMFKMDAPLRPEKQESFIKAMKACRKYTPDLIVINHRHDLGKAKPYVTTELWMGDESYIDVHMTSIQTATHHRVGALSRGLVPGLNRMMEDHGFCLSSCLDYWEDDLVMQAFNRCLLLAPEMYGSPWFLSDDEFPRLARLYNLHRQYRDIMIDGIVLSEEQYGKNAVSRGDNNTRLLTLSNLTWNSKSYMIRLDESIGLLSGERVTVVQYHPNEKVIGTFDYGETVPVDVYPFRSCLVMATTVPNEEPFITGCEYEMVRNVPGKDILINVMGLPGTRSKISLIPGHENITGATLDGKDISHMIIGEMVDIQFPGESLKEPWHRKIGEMQNIPVPKDAETLFEATCFANDNNALEVRSVERSGPTNIPQVQKARDAFFNQSHFFNRGAWDKFLFDGDLKIDVY